MSERGKLPRAVQIRVWVYRVDGVWSCFEGCAMLKPSCTTHAFDYRVLDPGSTRNKRHCGESIHIWHSTSYCLSRMAQVATDDPTRSSHVLQNFDCPEEDQRIAKKKSFVECTQLVSLFPCATYIRRRQWKSAWERDRHTGWQANTTSPPLLVHARVTDTRNSFRAIPFRMTWKHTSREHLLPFMTVITTISPSPYSLQDASRRLLWYNSPQSFNIQLCGWLPKDLKGLRMPAKARPTPKPPTPFLNTCIFQQAEVLNGATVVESVAP